MRLHSRRFTSKCIAPVHSASASIAEISPASFGREILGLDFKRHAKPFKRFWHATTSFLRSWILFMHSATRLMRIKRSGMATVLLSQVDLELKRATSVMVCDNDTTLSSD
jgi:hypothetical protein